MPQWNSVGKSLYLFLITCHKMVNLKHSIYLLHPFPKNALLFLFLILFFFILLSKSQYKCLQHLRNLFWTSKAIVTFICVHTVSCLYLTFYFSCHSRLHFFNIIKSSMIEAVYVIETFTFVGWTERNSVYIWPASEIIYINGIQIEEEFPQISEICSASQRW